jgi:hypothetical protein
METKHIKYDVDSGISIFCTKSGATETKQITPELVRYAIISYDISLINNSITRVREQYKLNKRNIEFSHDNFVLFFPLDNIIKPHDSQITLRSLEFYLKDSTKLKFQIDQTYSFIELQNNNNIHIAHTPSKIRVSTKAGKNLQVSVKSSQTSSSNNQYSTLAKREEGKDFSVDSFQKFKESIEKSDLLNLFTTKEKSLNSNLKSFGISLLCKLLLLIKYLNNLVDNEFQEDLQKFLKTNLLNSEVST